MNTYYTAKMRYVRDTSRKVCHAKATQGVETFVLSFIVSDHAPFSLESEAGQ